MVDPLSYRDDRTMCALVHKITDDVLYVKVNITLKGSYLLLDHMIVRATQTI